eukprot:GHVU01071434.1.p1 GENE.GHVU01071434.1~~GHVU01071434.1.p1  ORF type:complete len:367 (+),score=26.47 GHVU01071434.1:1478-2578(+)
MSVPVNASGAIPEESAPMGMNDGLLGNNENLPQVPGETQGDLYDMLKRPRTSDRGEVLPTLEGGEQEETRKMLMPLSKEQMIDLLCRCSNRYPDVLNTIRQTVEASPAARRLMIRNISFQTDNASLYDSFSQYGAIEDSTIVRERDGRSKGYGFVTYQSSTSVKQALAATISLDGRPLIVKLASDQSTGDAASPHGTTAADHSKAKRKLFVRNLGESTNTERLKGAFHEYGQIEDCVVVLDYQTSRSKGYGFVTFVRQEDAFRAVQQQQRIIDGQMTFVSYATPSPGGGPGRMHFQTGVPPPGPHAYRADGSVGYMKPGMGAAMGPIPGRAMPPTSDPHMMGQLPPHMYNPQIRAGLMGAAGGIQR